MTGAPLLYALLSLMIVGWAANYIAAKIAVQTFPPVLLYCIRMSMAGVLMAVVYAWHRRTNPPTWTLRDLPLMVLIGIFGVSLNQFLFVYGISETSVAHAAIFANMSPVLVLLLAGASGLEAMTPSKVAGVAVALGGVVLLRAMDARPHGAATLAGDGVVFLGSLAFSIFTVVGKPTAAKFGSISVMTVAYVGAALLVSPLTIWRISQFHLAAAPASAWLALTYMTVGPSVTCYLIYYYALARMEASRLTSLNYVLPVLATLLGVLILGEQVTLWTAVAGVVIFTGVYMVERAR
ncbi:MAG TPA: DMT family transporter [Bryobacteraceae bacterium]|nr:DMT family transporter [Bryobacteraceae bacterium]